MAWVIIIRSRPGVVVILSPPYVLDLFNSLLRARVPARSKCVWCSGEKRRSSETMAAKQRSVQAAAAALLCLVVLAASPRPALGNCRNECNAACNGWAVICQLSCASACYGEVGIATLSTTAAAPTPASAPAPAPQQGGGVSVLRGLKPSAAHGDGDGDAPRN